MSSALIAIFNAVVIATTLPMPYGGHGVRALHHFYDAGQLLALGLLSGSVIEAWQRWGPGRRSPPRFSLGWRRLLDYAALSAVCVVVGYLVLPEDLTTMAGRFPGPVMLWQAALVGAVSLTVPLAAMAALALTRRPRGKGFWIARGLTALVGLGVAAANQFTLANDYLGVHLFCTFLSVTILGVAVRADDPRPRGRVSAVLRALLAVAAALSIVVRPPNQVAIELVKVSGASLGQWLLRARLPGGKAEILADAGEWFKDRTSMPDIPPTLPPLLPKDGIIILLTIDALRADVVAADRHAELLPSLAALRRESVEFTDARSPASGTSAAIATLFSGRYYSQLYWSSMANYNSVTVYPHEETSDRFTDLLTKAGIDTVNLAGTSGLMNAVGVVRGFKEEQSLSEARSFGTAKTLINAALAVLRKPRSGPLFLYLHMTDPHSPYNLGGEQGSPFERYLREVALVDVQIGRLRRAIADLQLEERTVLILSADHGEAFGEHQSFFHSTTLYDELLHVPLLIQAPKARPRGVSTPVSLIDLGPTILDLMGAPTPATFMGQSLTPFLRGEDPALTRPLIAESSRWMRAMVFPDRWKVIYDTHKGIYELYDLSTDPGELRNLADQSGEVGAHRLGVLRAFFQVHELSRPGYVIPFAR